VVLQEEKAGDVFRNKKKEPALTGGFSKKQ
jgi:hypothetical protein